MKYIKHYWCEKYLGKNKNPVVYFGTVDGFRVGLVLGYENYLYLGWFCIGADFDT